MTEAEIFENFGRAMWAAVSPEAMALARKQCQDDLNDYAAPHHIGDVVFVLDTHLVPCIRQQRVGEIQVITRELSSLTGWRFWLADLEGHSNNDFGWARSWEVFKTKDELVRYYDKILNK